MIIMIWSLDGRKKVFGLTTPLITLASGAKMGKTTDGAIWLDKKFLSPYEYWQFWRNTDDRDVLKFLKYFTDITFDELNKIKSKNINDLKIILADQATAMLHGNKESLKANKAAKDAFSSKLSTSNIPSIKIKKFEIKKKINIIDMIIISKLENSKSEVRRLIKGKAIKINNKLIENEKFIISEGLFENDSLRLSIGKKRHFKIVLN